MFQVYNYFGQYQGLRSRFGGLPGWGRGIVGILAIPGIVLILLSILLLGVSILALLLLTVPAYRALRFLTAGSDDGNEQTGQTVVVSEVEPGRRSVDVKVIE